MMGVLMSENTLSIEEVKQNLINCDIKLVSYSSTKKIHVFKYVIIRTVRETSK